MKIKKMIFMGLSVVLALSLASTAAAAGQDGANAVKLNTTDHMKYMDGMPSGLFKPDEPLTRGAACQLLYNLMTETVDITVSFPDVPSNMWYYEAVSGLASVGLICGDGTGYLKPDGIMTRAEFVVLLTRFFPIIDGKLSFSDVPANSWATEALTSAEAMGWIKGSGNGNFRPNDAVTRAEAAVIMNRVLQRSASREVVDTAAGIRIFPDLPKDYWAYYDIMEATIGHEYSKASGAEIWSSFTAEKTAIEPGFRLVDGQLYYEDENGYFVRNETVGTFTFDAQGRSTTGNQELDAYLTEVILKVTNPAMTRPQMLRAVYEYTRDNFSYIVRPIYDTGDTSWVEQEALYMFRKGYDNCYGFAAVFSLLARRLGYDATVISGTVSDHNSPHGWAEIVFDGKSYIFDAVIERYHRSNGDMIDLFMLSYDKVPWPYGK